MHRLFGQRYKLLSKFILHKPQQSIAALCSVLIFIPTFLTAAAIPKAKDSQTAVSYQETCAAWVYKQFATSHDLHIPCRNSNGILVTLIINLTDDAFSSADGIESLRSERTHERIVNQQDAAGMTPLLYASQHLAPKVFAWLVQEGADVSVRNKKGQGVLDLAVNSFIISSASTRELTSRTILLSIIRQLAAQKSDIIQENRMQVWLESAALSCLDGDADAHRSHRTPIKKPLLQIAAQCCWEDTVELCLQLGASPEEQDDEGNTSLHCAGNNSAAHLLLHAGADIGKKNHKGETPLHTSASALVAGALLDADKSRRSETLWTRDAEGRTALHTMAMKDTTQKPLVSLISSIMEHAIARSTDPHLLYLLPDTSGHYILDMAAQATPTTHMYKLRPTSAPPVPFCGNATQLAGKVCNFETIQERAQKARTTLHFLLELVPLIAQHKLSFPYLCYLLECAIAARNIDNVKIVYALIKPDDATGEAIFDVLFHKIPPLLSTPSTAHKKDFFLEHILEFLLHALTSHPHLQDRINLLPHACASSCISFVGMEIIMQYIDAPFKRDSTGSTALHHAVHRENVCAVYSILRHGGRAWAVDQSGQTPLHVAVTKGNRAITKAVLKRTPPLQVSQASSDGKTALHIAAEQSHCHIIPLLLRHGLRPTTQDKQGKTVLHYLMKNDLQEACAFSSEIRNALFASCSHIPDALGRFPIHCAKSSATLQTLLMYGCPYDKKREYVNARDKENKTPLHHAAFFGLTDVVRSLTHNEASWGPKDDFQKTPLDYATENNHQTAASLLRKNSSGAEAKPKSVHDSSDESCRAHSSGEALETAISYPLQSHHNNTELHQAVLDHNEQRLVELLSSGADIEQKNDDGATALLLAAVQGDKNLVRVLLYKKKLLPGIPANVNTQDKAGRTPLSHAVLSGPCGDILELLLTSGANPAIADCDGRTPLHHLAITCDQMSDHQADMAQKLLMHGAKVDVQDAQGNTPVHLVVPLPRNMMDDFCERNRTPLRTKAKARWPNYFKDVLKRYDEQHGYNNNCSDVLRLLVAHPTADVRLSNNAGDTALHLAARANKCGHLAALMRHGADTSAQNAQGQNPLHSAVQMDNIRCIEALCERSTSESDPRLQADDSGMLPLHYATSSRSIECLQKSDYDACFHANNYRGCVDSDGKNALHHAVIHDRPDVVQGLLKIGLSAQLPDYSGASAYDYALKLNRTKMIKILGHHLLKCYQKHKDL